jgi:acetyl-CoA carboxylase biotin carboxyl carrier protein
MATIDVKSEIGGVVWKIETTVGTALVEDDTILILESMKMEIPIIAPRAGTLSEILVSENETVQEGQIVARMTA